MSMIFIVNVAKLIFGLLLIIFTGFHNSLIQTVNIICTALVFGHVQEGGGIYEKVMLIFDPSLL